MAVKKPSPAKITAERQALDRYNFDRLVKKIERVTSTHSAEVRHWVEWMLEMGLDSVELADGTVRELVSTNYDEVWGITDNAGQLIRYVNLDYVTGVEDQVEDAEEKVQNYVDTQAGGVAETTEKASDGVLGWITGGLSDLWDGITDVYDLIKTTVKGWFDTLSDKVADIRESLGASFEDMISALFSIPEIILGFRDELAEWFRFDWDEFSAMIQKARGG